MEEQTVTAWLVNWFKERQEDPEAVIDMDAEYYASGLVDSFGIIELISAVEEKFGIIFTDEELKMPGFRVPSGLIKVINSKMQD